MDRNLARAAFAVKRAVVLLALFGAACSAQPTVIDGSTAQRFRETSAAARGDLANRDRLAFDAAMKRVPGSPVVTAPGAMEELARTTYNGMTAQDVVDLTR